VKLLSLVAAPVLLLLLSSDVFPQTAEQSDGKIAAQSADVAFRSGNALMEEKKYCEALSRYTEGLRSAPNDTSLLYNGGLAAFQCKQYAEALNLWSRIKTLEPEDWQTRAKLIQTYQTLGKLPERDAERVELFELRKRDPNSELAKQVEYCRDQFEAGGEKVMAFERFELKGDRALRYVFSIVDESTNDVKYRLSLGSYESTNAYWHEATKPKPKDTDRLFHLDGYYEWGHATYGMYFPEPSYDQVRATVIEVLEKKKKPQSTTTINSRPSPD
jgi:tetratricopeptide (TPR) repeat protein